MKKIYTILSGLFLAVVLALGIVTLFSSADGASKPKMSFAGLFSGSYSGERRGYYAQKFPKSEGLKNWNTRLNGFYKYSGLTGDEDVQIMIDMQNTAADGGASLETPAASTAPTEPADPNAGSTTEPPETESTQETPPDSGVPEDAVVENLGAALLIGDRAIEVPYANYGTIEQYAKTVTDLAAALGPQIRTFNIAVPNAAEFYTTEDYHTGSSSQKDMIDYCYDHLGSNVISVDAYTQLRNHVDEYIYFRTDHHWTQLGAYYAYIAFCEEAGLPVQPLEKFETGQYDNFVGSMYNFLSDYPQSSVLKENPDTLYFYRPYVEIDTHFYMDATLSMAYDIGTISYVADKYSNKYLCFLGGDHPVTIIETDVEGPVCMLLKESYGNAFAPWLTSHYSKVIVIDPREFNRDGKPSLDLVSFAAEQGVDDCIILNYPMMLNSEAYIRWLGRLAP